ncbi:MAG: hypothetical protein CMM00_12360 [Rhodopirellula sp.]|uniref:DUF7919 family protein n=1 Tax=Rhodopirellula TaxID=265488 RepID=UPI000C546816|nr:hypothetical protein [Rhodopirellula sp. UBA1907]MAP09550.1 hypothetical protein [Rhodopirellula sp.]MCR9210144.1 hypothetical protein [bacterium]|tara:strand:- start:28 stop:453 length:426 start_codon:yes stop_codon:yes gene_type:complete
MTHFDDFAQCDYFSENSAQTLRAIGWLSNAKAFPTGPIDSKTFSKLKELLNAPWQPVVFAGVHNCDLCQFDPPCGHVNLFVPNGSIIFVCPELIVHYIAAHHYRPPHDFLSAVKDCPNTRTMQYKKRLLESGGRTLLPKAG